MAVSGDPGSDDDLGALGFLHEGKRLRRTECDELVQSLFSRKRSFLAVSHGLGIQRDETKPGYQHILLKPQPGPLEFMKGSVDSPYGVISAGWERKGDKIEYQVTIPVNTTATLFKNTQDPADTVELGSGTYTFML